MDKTEKYREIENQPIAYTEEGEVFYIVDLNNYEKMKYLGYDKDNNALRYTRYSTGKKIYRIPLEDTRGCNRVSAPFFVFKFIIRKFTNKIKLNIKQTRNI